MGQAALDLPDPLQSPPQAPQTSTDELLAQLAGDEIDRLLAEADGGAPRPAAAPFHVAPPTAPEQGPTEPTAEAPAAAPAPSVVEQEVTAELDALFTAAVEKDKAADAAEAATAEQASAAERAGLAVPGAPATPADDEALPWYLRPLEWLSAPLMIFPPGVRDLIGKAAIVTLLNATAILIYVLIVRGR